MENQSKPVSILVVDDDSLMLRLLRLAISSAGFQVMAAPDAEQALHLATQHGPLDLVVTDIEMPGKNGLQLAEALCTGRLATRFLFVSGSPDYQNFQERVGGGEFDGSVFLKKPFALSELLSVVHSLLQPEGLEKTNEAWVRHRTRRAELQPPAAGRPADAYHDPDVGHPKENEAGRPLHFSDQCLVE